MQKKMYVVALYQEEWRNFQRRMIAKTEYILRTDLLVFYLYPNEDKRGLCEQYQ